MKPHHYTPFILALLLSGLVLAQQDPTTALCIHGEAFVAMMNSDDPQAQVEFARDHLDPALTRDGRGSKAVASLRRDFDVQGKVIAHKLQVVSGGRVLFVYVKREKTGVWQNYQFRCNAAEEYRLKPVFISMAVEPIARPNAPIDSPETATWLDRFIGSMDQQQPFNGVVLVQKNGKDVYVNVRGIAQAERREPMRRDSRLNTASGSKMFTAVAILQLAQDGRLSLDDPISRHLPDFPNQEWSRTATIRQLLSHTGGAGNYWDQEYTRTGLGITDTAGFLPHALRHLGETPVGTFSYSNSGYIILGLIIEKISGQPYADYLAERVFSPAGMKATGFPLRSAGEPGVAGLYKPVFEAGAAVKGSFDPPQVGERGSPAGGAATTVDDMCRFVRALSDGTLLSAESFKQMTSKQSEMDAADSAYGLGTILMTARGVASFGHGGMGPGTQFECRCYPAQGVVVVVMSNLDTIAAHEVQSAIDEIIRAEPGK